MGSTTNTVYHCDRCKKRLKTCNNEMLIETSLEEGYFWSRLQVQLIHRHGTNNGGKEEKAELCQKCAIWVLTDALKRVKAGERTTKGCGNTDQQGWNG